MKLNGLENYFKTVNGEIVDFKQVNKNNETPLLYAFSYNKIHNLNLSKKQFDYLIRNSDLEYIKDGYITPFIIFLFYKELENLKLNKTTFKYLIQNSNLDRIDYLDLNNESNLIVYNKLKEIRKKNIKYIAYDCNKTDYKSHYESFFYNEKKYYIECVKNTYNEDYFKLYKFKIEAIKELLQK